ncbi:zinc finger, CCHC-type, retrotransposon gag domain protein [Tanacetum coccineum]
MVNTRTDAELAAAVQAAVDAMLPQIREQVREEYRNGASGSGGNPPPVTIHTWLERFNKQKPRTFEKAVTPVDAENWISHMEKIFDVMGCDDVFKARLAVYKFEGDALAWWKAYKQAKGGDAWILTLSWANFKELFFLQFFPRAEQERLKREYHSLRQRAGESSNEFMQRFIRIAGFLGQAAGTAPQERSRPRTFVGVFTNAARNFEILRDRDDYDRPERSDKRNSGAGPRQAIEQGSAVLTEQQLLQNKAPSEGYTYPVCTTCGRRHPGECRRAAGFLANIHDTTSDVSSIHDQPIVSEFQDVFPEELPGIPPIRDVEFNIELIPGAEPISKAP